MLHPLLSRAPDRVRTLLILLLGPLALLGLVFCGHLFLFPLWLAIRFWPTGPARWIALAATLGVLGYFARNSVLYTVATWREARAVALDQIMFSIGCLIWAAAVVFLGVYA
jgi:hypothetical protein